jgi:hypothetical protein
MNNGALRNIPQRMAQADSLNPTWKVYEMGFYFPVFGPPSEANSKNSPPVCTNIVLFGLASRTQLNRLIGTLTGPFLLGCMRRVY